MSVFLGITPLEPRKKVLYGLEAASNGALKHLVYLTASLDKIKFDVTVLVSDLRSSPGFDKQIKKMVDSGVKVEILSMTRNIHLRNDLKAFIKVYQYLGRSNFDIVHSHSSKAGILFRLAAWLHNVPMIVYTPHCYYFQSLTGFRRLLFTNIEKIVSKITDITIVSDNEKRQALKYKVTPKYKLRTINNAIPFNEAVIQTNQSDKIKEKFGITSQYIIAGVGRLTEQKGWFNFLYAANEVIKINPEIIFLIVGEGHLKKRLDEMIINLGISDNVFLTGHIYEINQIYKIINVFVSTALWEGLPYSFLEAMQSKKPMITTNVGHEDVIKNEENGYLVGVDDFKAIAARILYLWKNKSIGVQMGKNGFYRLNKKFRYDEFVIQHENLYLNVDTYVSS